jgi:hypothetical protein
VKLQPSSSGDVPATGPASEERFVSEREMHCDTCGDVQPFETPPCVDGHGVDCPELICTGCGAAVMIATFVFRAARLSARRPPTIRRRAA